MQLPSGGTASRAAAMPWQLADVATGERSLRCETDCDRRPGETGRALEEALEEGRILVIDAERLVYESFTPGAGGSVSLLLTPLELIERLAALIPPPRRQAGEPQEAATRLSGARMALAGRQLPVAALESSRTPKCPLSGNATDRVRPGTARPQGWGGRSLLLRLPNRPCWLSAGALTGHKPARAYTFLFIGQGIDFVQLFHDDVKS
jgi:hypothetical protein